MSGSSATVETDPTTSDGPLSPDGPQAPDGPLTPEHYDELARAKDRIKPIRRAAGVAAFNGWTIAIIAALSLPFAVLGWDGLLVSIGLFIVAYFEFRGRRQLLKFDPGGASLLGWNQVGFLSLIIVYCLWMLFGGTSDIENHPELSQFLGTAGKELYRSLVITLYGSVIVLSLVFQGGNAIYYFTRRKYVDAYLHETPQWVRDFQRATAAN
ncbi:efflux RND transporter permease subunit [Roseiconus nitratireducens]|uniref:Efflux RND transporter permease subunit n=1 Tax=Roseiconus nitratireducens TaxID=2605748 RepID=A0A5M6D7Z6_9BACT|nr:efflux RND transporter permease subunit [Roseiconus nitratireducens]KAA5542776.1 efflux RND transporter permease subunit [Roseiconus nitratireducens]